MNREDPVEASLFFVTIRSAIDHSKSCNPRIAPNHALGARSGGGVPSRWTAGECLAGQLSVHDGPITALRIGPGAVATARAESSKELRGARGERVNAAKEVMMQGSICALTWRAGWSPFIIKAEKLTLLGQVTQFQITTITMRTTKQTGFPTLGEWRIVAALYDLGGEAGVAKLHAHVGGSAWNDSNTRTYLLKLCAKGWVEQYRPTTRFRTASGSGRPRALYRSAIPERDAYAQLADHLIEHYCFDRVERARWLAELLSRQSVDCHHDSEEEDLGHSDSSGADRSMRSQSLSRQSAEDRPKRSRAQTPERGDAQKPKGAGAQKEEHVGT